MVVKEFLQFSRDIILILFMVYAFTGNIYMAGSGVSFQLLEAPMLVVDHDRSPASRELVSRFRPPAFSEPGYADSIDEAMGRLDRGTAMLFLDIPADFAEDVGEGEQTAVGIRVDTTNTLLGNLAAGYSSTIVREYGRELTQERLQVGRDDPLPLPAVESTFRVWYNPARLDSWFSSLTQLANFVTLFAVLLPAAAMVREKEKGTIEQLLVTPLTPFEIMFPKVLAMAVIIVIGAAACVFGVLRPAFDIPIRGSLTLFFAVTALHVFAVSGLGMVIATLARNLGQAGLMTILIYGPMILLSGAWTPPEAMPEFMHIFLVISPLHYYLTASLGIFLKGTGLDVLWEPIGAIFLIGSILFGVGMLRLRTQFQ
jgi:ABC-2 type transport system permease protein